MAYSESEVTVSVVTGATFTSTQVGRFVVIDSSGHVVLPNTTGNVLPFGVLREQTASTSAPGSQAVKVAIGGITGVRMAASTLAPGQFVAASTVGLGIAPTTDAYTAGVIVAGTSGAAGRVVSVRLFTGPLNTP